MASDADPILYNWYYHLDKGPHFRVVAVDDDRGLVEIQYFDGQVEEVDMDAWYEMEVEPSEAPENWSGAMDISEADDYGEDITDTKADDWNEPLEEIRRPEKEPEDDWSEGYPEEEPWEGEK